MIDYDATRDALYRPALRPTVFAAGAPVSPDAVCAECSRLAYRHFESDAAHRQQLVDSLASAGLTQWAGFADAQTGTEAFAVVRQDSGETLVAFRGTDSGRDVLSDVNPHGIGMEFLRCHDYDPTVARS